MLDSRAVLVKFNTRIIRFNFVEICRRCESLNEWQLKKFEQEEIENFVEECFWFYRGKSCSDQPE